MGREAMYVSISPLSDSDVHQKLRTTALKPYFGLMNSISNLMHYPNPSKISYTREKNSNSTNYLIAN